MAFNELLRNEEPNPGTNGGARREECLKYFRQIACGDANASVGNHQRASTDGFFRVLDDDRKMTPIGHRVNGIRNEVKKKLASSRLYEWSVCIQIGERR